jgi:hypothetical protein
MKCKMSTPDSMGVGHLMTPIYVKGLFSLMKYLGLEQKDVARRLGGVSDTTTSLWATGKRPISRKYEEPFLNLVAEVIREEEERAGVNSAHAREMVGYLDAWVQEMHIKVGTFQRTLQRQFEILNHPRAREDASRLSKRERHTLKVAAQLVVHLLDYLESIGRPVRREGVAQKTAPAAYFTQIRRSYREE